MAEPRFFLLSIPDPIHLVRPVVTSIMPVISQPTHSCLSSLPGSPFSLWFFRYRNPRLPAQVDREYLPRSIHSLVLARGCSFYSSLLRNANGQASLSATVLFLSPSVPTFVPCTPIGSRSNLLLVTKSSQVDVILSAEFPPSHLHMENSTDRESQYKQKPCLSQQSMFPLSYRAILDFIDG